jgi:peptide/nickel transport system substrate-binding protein
MLRTTLFAFVLILITALCAQAAAPEKSSPKKDSITTVLNFELDSLNPVVAVSVSSIFILDATVRYPMALDISGKPMAFLVKEVPTVENHKVSFFPTKEGRGMKIDLEFLPKAAWGDGEPVTCDDLKLTWEIGSNMNVSVPSRDIFTDITDVKIDPTNPKKCSVFVKKAQWSYYLNFPRMLSAHIERPIFEKYKNQPQAYERNSAYVRDPKQPGLYNGAYRIIEYKMGEYVRMVPNEHFYGPTPYFKTVTVKFILNTATIEANLLSGSVDMVSSSGFTLDQALIFEKRIEKEHLPYKMNMKPSMLFSFLDCNLDNPILSDVRVRKALSYMINREELINSFYGGRLTAAYTFANPIDSYYTLNPKQIQLYRYNKTKANQLLDEAGWVLNKEDGIRYKDGKPLRLTMSAGADIKIVETIEVFIKNSWKSVGVDMQIKNYPGRVLFSQIIPHRNFDLAFYSMSGSPDDDHRTLYHSSFIPSEKNSFSGQNSAGWKNPDVDKWLDQEQLEFDPKKRKPLMLKIMKAYNAELPTIPLYFRSMNSVTPIDLKGYDMAPHQFSEFSHIEDWKY